MTLKLVACALAATAHFASAALKSVCVDADAAGCLGSAGLGVANDAMCQRVIHIAGIFPMSGRLCFEGIQAAAAAQQAVDDINSVGGLINHGLLGGDTAADEGFCLSLHARDSRNEPGMALHEVDSFMQFGQWNSYNHIDAVIGGLSSDVSKAVQQLLQWASIPQISYGSTTPALSNKETNPTFFRTVPSDSLLVIGVVEFLETQDWEFVTVLASDSEFGQAGAALLRQEVARRNTRLSVQSIVTFNDDNLEKVMEELKYSEGRVIFLHCSVAEADDVFKIAAESDMLGAGWAWIGSEWAQDSLFEEFEESGPALDALKASMQGIVALRPTNFKTPVASNIGRHLNSAEANVTYGSVLRDCESVSKAGHINSVAFFAYDAVLVAATAIDRAVERYGDSASSNFSAIFKELTGLEDTVISNGATGDIK